MDNTQDLCNIEGDDEDEGEGRNDDSCCSSSTSYRLFGRQMSIHQMMGGGKAADVILWKRQHVSCGIVVVATVAWILFEQSGLSFLLICSDVLLILVVLLFLQANYAVFRKKHLRTLPELVLSEEMVINAAASFRVKINYVLLLAHDITLGRDFRLFFKQGNSGKNTSVATRKRREILAKKNIGSTINYGMDNTGTKKSKNNAKATRRFWNKHEEDFLIGAMKDVFLSDPKWKRDNNQFRPGFYNLCEKKILLAFAGTDLRASPHIESKIKLWRKQYSTLYDMVNASGFGWDDCEKMVLVDSDDVWSNYVKRVPDAKGMRNKPFPYYEDWLILFGKDRATGELAEGPAESVAAMENEETIRGKGDESPVEQFWFNETDIDYSMSPSGNTTNPADSSKPPDSSKAGKKRVRPAAGISQGLSEMAVTFGAFFENTNSRMAEIAHRIGYSHDLSQQRRLVNTELLKLPMSTAQRLKVASMIVKDEERVDLFFSLEEDDKMEWVCMLLEGSII